MDDREKLKILRTCTFELQKIAKPSDDPAIKEIVRLIRKQIMDVYKTHPEWVRDLRLIIHTICQDHPTMSDYLHKL
jgi:hypothetical protein